MRLLVVPLVIVVLGTSLVVAAEEPSAKPAPKQFEGNEPRLIETDRDGTLSLPASACEVYGPELEYMPEDRALGYWHQVTDYCVWKIDVARPGRYAVLIEWSCAIDSAGNSFELLVDGARMTNTVPSSGGWQRHLWAQFGVVEISRGQHELTIRPLPEIRRALMDLREVKLVPIVEPRGDR